MEKLSNKKLSIPILLGSSRIGRQSSKVAEFIFQKMIVQDSIDTKLIDLKDYNLPMLEERLNEMKNPPESLLQFCSQLGQADGILIVTPEYKNGYPAVLKNALDYLEPQALYHKPIGICTVSAGGFGGLNCLAQLRLVCLALGGLPIPEKLSISQVREIFDEEGNLQDATLPSKVESFINELVWYVEALARQK
ncbi:NAD(P)H-dependent oxidoreductase [Spirulina sp. 06S082]|uniref:NADPH-dependent FMN reductase n=1 Tax=Spirulina sp. 06S082 TaxID=3110248 RepID=UPI002B1F5501|nr:NAD(P)H-dependent oxidoreductase [Spirulina sp. 06S082]MEA5468852.1 NAD(P)H-dependent oxidoreductase [Spirulina sp. 06S082]